MTPILTPEQRTARLADLGAAATMLLGALSDRALTDEEIAATIDRAIDTGPLDALDDGVIRFAVARLDDLAEVFRRDPARMRGRAAALETSHPERAARLRARAATVERRQAGR